MQKRLTKKEFNKAEMIKAEFSRVRDEISEIQEKMNHLNLEAGTLLRELESLREAEKEFVDDLGKKYGDGKLNPFTMTYEID